MKHIAMLIPTVDQIGGAERQVLLLAQELSRRGWRVTLVALSGTGSAATEALAESGISYISLGMRRGWVDPQGWARYRAWASKNEPQIVHAHLPHATWFSRWVRLLAPVCVAIDTIHTSNTGTSGRRLGYRLSGWLSDRVTCVSQSVAEAALSARMVPPKKLTVLPNGVPVPPPHLPQQRSCFHWIAIGRLAPVKDYPTLLRAFAALPDQARLLVAGAGPDESALRDLAAQLNIQHRVAFAGFHSDVQPLLNTANGFVLSSLWEGLPVSVLEAQAAGLPVVATDTAGTREAMLPGQSGLLVPIGDADALMQAMSQIMARPEDDRRRMGQQGRHFVEQNFSLPAIVSQWEQLYTNLLEAQLRPTRRGHTPSAPLTR